MILGRIQKFLEEAIGLDPAALSVQVVRSSVKRRMRALCCEHWEEYGNLISNNAEEVQSLIQEVVIPETSFFRYPDSFLFLTQYFLGENSFAHNNKPLKILSLPCSTGEEPYSIAMSLLNAGFQPQDFLIDAVDVSNRSLHFARKAIYRSGAFRNPVAKKQLHYFDYSQGEYQLKAKPRASVRFHFGNLLQENYTPPEMDYDLVLCRNLLIYFSRENQEIAMNKLTGMMKKGSVLMLGHCDAQLAQSGSLTLIAHPGAFAFRKQEDRTPRQTPRMIAEKKSLQKARPVIKVSPTQTLPNAPTPSLLQQAKRAADRGKLVEAIELCELDLSENAPNPDTLFLLGLTAQSLGASKVAKHNFELALKLDTNHYDTLVALSFLAQREGDAKLSAQLAYRAAANLSDAKSMSS